MRHTKGQVLGRRTRRALNWTAVVAAMGAVGAVGVRSLRGGSPPRATVAAATASRGDIVVSVGAVGRIVAARSTLQTAQPAVGTAAAPSLDAVYPNTRGNIARLLVSANQRVTRGQAIAVVDDGGAAASAVALAQTRLATASLEAQQSEDVAALAVTRAKADLEKLQGGTPVAHARALEVARRSVALAKQRLAGVGARPTAADLGAAESDVQKAEADLATLLQAAPRPDLKELYNKQHKVFRALYERNKDLMKQS